MTVEPTGATAAMECADIERSLDAWLDGEFDAQDGAEVAHHLAGCDACRTLADRHGALRDATRRCLRSALGGARAPDALRLRIVGALDRDRQPWWRRLLSPAPVAALVACVAVVYLVTQVHRGEDLLVEEAVRRHVRDLPLEVTAAAIGPESIPSWFAGKLDFNPRPPRFAAPGVRLVGARLSHISDRPAAYMRYDLPRGHVGLFIVEDPEHRFGDCLRPRHLRGCDVCLAHMRGYHLAAWRQGEIVYSLVGDVDEAQLAQLVETAAAGASDR